MPVDIESIHKEILAGLPNDRARLDDALFNLEYYRGDFSRFPTRPAGDDKRYERTSLFMQRAVNVLSKLLYKSGPKRTLTGHDAATLWLEGVYARNAADALLRQADRYTYISDVAAVQVEPAEGDADCAVHLHLWSAESFLVWPLPGEPARAGAVAVIDRDDCRRRLRLWTADEVRYYQTDKWEEGKTKTAGATAYKLVSSEPNALGVIPFGFIHYEQPTNEFWTAGPGTHLRGSNDCVNKRLTTLFDGCETGLDPALVATDTRVGWRPPSPRRPGDVWYFDTRVSAAGEAIGSPKAEYLQADPGFVAAGWEDLDSAIDHDLEMAGVQPSQVRMTQTTAASGDAIVAEQIEPVTDAEGRQSKAAREEEALAKLVLAIGAKHLGSQPSGAYAATAAQLEAAALAPGFSLKWPDLYPDLPGPARDAEDDWMLSHGLTSLTQVTARRYKLSEKDAQEHLERVAEQRAFEATLFAEPEAPADDKDKKPDPNVDPADDDGTDGEGGDE